MIRIPNGISYLSKFESVIENVCLMCDVFPVTSFALSPDRCLLSCLKRLLCIHCLKHLFESCSREELVYR